MHNPIDHSTIWIQYWVSMTEFDGSIYLLGGLGRDSDISSVVERYEARMDAWIPCDNMGTLGPRYAHIACTLHDESPKEWVTTNI